MDSISNWATTVYESVSNTGQCLNIKGVSLATGVRLYVLAGKLKDGFAIWQAFFIREG